RRLPAHDRRLRGVARDGRRAVRRQPSAVPHRRAAAQRRRQDPRLRSLLTVGSLGPQMAPVIEVHGLRKSYGDLEAVRGIDLEVSSGEVFALLGPNGAGKTTTV